jgi:hypothetical protein
MADGWEDHAEEETNGTHQDEPFGAGEPASRLARVAGWVPQL